MFQRNLIDRAGRQTTQSRFAGVKRLRSGGIGRLLSKLPPIPWTLLFSLGHAERLLLPLRFFSRRWTGTRLPCQTRSNLKHRLGMLLPLSLLSLGTLVLARPAIDLESGGSAVVKRNNDVSSYGGPTVQIRNGTVEGIAIEPFQQEGECIQDPAQAVGMLTRIRTAFLGMPYAQPPTGDRRLRKPQSLEKAFEGGKYRADNYSVFVSCHLQDTASGRR